MSNSNVDSVLSGIWINPDLDKKITTLTLQSEVLKNNPWGDASLRRHYVYSPNPSSRLPVILYLPGFLSSAQKSFSFKGFEPNFFELLNNLEKNNLLPHAHIVCVDAWTMWGGSQYLNSQGMGSYQSHIIDELLPSLAKNYLTNGRFALLGGSSGGYGALSLMRSGKFEYVAAIAPDSFFEASLLPDIYKATPSLVKLGGIEGVFKKLKTGELFKNKNFFSIINSVAMGLCYDSKQGDSEIPYSFNWPIDLESGEVKKDVWNKWLSHDPLYFLKDFNVKDVKLYLSAPRNDEFNLQFGAKQISDIIKDETQLTFQMFDGTHRDLSQDLPSALSWLKQNINGI